MAKKTIYQSIPGKENWVEKIFLFSGRRQGKMALLKNDVWKKPTLKSEEKEMKDPIITEKDGIYYMEWEGKNYKANRLDDDKKQDCEECVFKIKGKVNCFVMSHTNTWFCDQQPAFSWKENREPIEAKKTRDNMDTAKLTKYSNLILAEYRRAKKLHPLWPDDIIHAVAIVCEESGESIRAALNVQYENGNIEDVEKELIQTASTCLRCLVNLRQK